jgi:quercetin dioxygenase-like cupin family protein
MFPTIRRVVTGHDDHGKAVILKDHICDNFASKRPGQSGAVLWTTDCSPADNADPTDGSSRKVGTTSPNGTVFRVVSYAPGVTPRVHRSNSIDYAIVLEGSIVMELDDGVRTTLNAGDMLVQRGTIHNWINEGDAPCVMAFVLVDAKPIELNGTLLGAVG